MATRPSRSDSAIRGLLVLLALAVRIPLLLQADFVTYDGTYYINQAKALLHGSLGGGAFPLGYPLLIAPVLAVVRDGVLAAALVSLLASLGSVVVFDSLCRRRMRRPLALLAAAVFAMTPLFMRVSVLSVAESAYTFWVLLALHQFPRRAWASGLAIGMAAATRPEAIAVAAGLGALTAYALVRNRSRANARALAALALAFLVVYGAGVAAMSIAHGRFTPLSRAGAFRSLALPWQLREKTIAFEGREQAIAALEEERGEFDRGRSYAGAAQEAAAGLSRQLMFLLPALAVVGIATHRGYVAVALLPLVVIPFFTEARGHVRWLVPYLAPLIYYAMITVDATRRPRERAWLAGSVAVLAAASWWFNRGVFASGVESEYASTKGVAQRFAARLQPGDAIADRKPYFAFYAGAPYVEIPAAPYDETIAYLVQGGVRFLALHAKTVDRLRPVLRPLVFDEAAVRGELRYRQVIHETTGEFVYERTGATDSLSARRLTQSELGDLSPAWSPEGTRIAFRRYLPDGGAGIYLVDRDGENLVELARTTRERDPIAWAPDGRSLVFTSRSEDNLDLVSVDVSTRRTTRVESTELQEWSPAISRDTRALVFCSDRDGTPSVWRLGVDARAPARVSTGAPADCASVSPSGRRVTWSDLEGRLIVWDVDAGEGTGVFEPRGVVWPASWNPDERMVVIEAYDWGASHLYLVDVARGRALMLTRSRLGEGMPSWSPDGREIVAVSGREGAPSLWVYGNLTPYVNRLFEEDDVAVLQRPEPLRTPVPDGLRRVLPTPARPR